MTWQSSLFLSSALCHLIRFYNAATDEEKLTAAASLCEILRQIDQGRKVCVDENSTFFTVKMILAGLFERDLYEFYKEII
ncbi:MAG TPA: hypothetical protein ENL07_09055 [Chlorobaculum parvum]|uniref:Uncharacterized protein n=1 Tax=Chlorobaculum parvum TaxID=274539 RepID=A0A7C5HTH7_9CHLB|nr:hypothetical protein [Chlorobaculum parvum]